MTFDISKRVYYLISEGIISLNFHVNDINSDAG